MWQQASHNFPFTQSGFQNDNVCVSLYIYSNVVWDFTPEDDKNDVASIWEAEDNEELIVTFPNLPPPFLSVHIQL